METFGERAKEILNELHTERLDYESEYLPLIDCALQCIAYEDTGLEPDQVDQIRRASEKMMFESVGDFVRYSISNFEALEKYRNAEQDGRLVVLPEVSEADRTLFADNLKDVFDEWANYDPSVGIFGMSDGEAALANALIHGLKSIKY